MFLNSIGSRLVLIFTLYKCKGFLNVMALYVYSSELANEKAAIARGSSIFEFSYFLDFLQLGIFCVLQLRANFL